MHSHWCPVKESPSTLLDLQLSQGPVLLTHPYEKGEGVGPEFSPSWALTPLAVACGQAPVLCPLRRGLVLTETEGAEGWPCSSLGTSKGESCAGLSLQSVSACRAQTTCQPCARPEDEEMRDLVLPSKPLFISTCSW